MNKDESYLRDSMEYISKKNMVTPRKERIRNGHEVEYRKRIINGNGTELGNGFNSVSLFLKNGGDATQKDLLQEYWKNNISADNIIHNNDSTSYIRTDAQTASVVTSLITGPKPLAKSFSNNKNNFGKAPQGLGMQGLGTRGPQGLGGYRESGIKPGPGPASRIASFQDSTSASTSNLLKKRVRFE